MALDRLSVTRRYTIHVPQLVGRISYPQHKQDVHEAMRRLVSEYDTAMAELQNFLKYLQSTSDEVVAAGGYYAFDPSMVDSGPAFVGTPGVGYALGDHEHQADVGPATGLGNANAIGAGPKLAHNDHVHKRDVRVARAGVDIGTRNRINLSTDFTVTDDPGNDEVDIAIGAAASTAFWKLMSVTSLGF